MYILFCFVKEKFIVLILHTYITCFYTYILEFVVSVPCSEKLDWFLRDDDVHRFHVCVVNFRREHDRSFEVVGVSLCIE